MNWRRYWTIAALSLFICTAVMVQLPSVHPAEVVSAESLLQQGNQQFAAGKLEAAIDFWQQARTAYQQAQNRTGEAAALENLGAAYVDLERYQDAIAALDACLPLARSLKNLPQEARVLSNLGIAYRTLGNYAQSIQLHQQAGRLLRQVGDRAALSQVLINLGNAFEAVGEYDKATIAFQQSLKLVQQTGDRQSEAIALSNLGAIHANLGEYSQAIALYEQSLRMSQALGDRSAQASTLINLGSTYHSLKQTAKARNYYQQALELAQAVGDRGRESEAFGSLGLAAEDEKAYGQAIAYQQKSLAIARSLADVEAESLALNNLGHTLFKAGKLTEAEATVLQAAQLLDRLRLGLGDREHVSLFDTQLNTYSLLQQIRVAANRPEAALEAAEQGRARAFTSLLAQRSRQRGTQSSTGGTQSWNDRAANPSDAVPNAENPVSNANNVVPDATLLDSNRNHRVQTATDAVPRSHHPVPPAKLVTQKGTHQVQSANPAIAAPTVEEIRQIAREQNATLVEYAIVPDDDFKFRGRQRAKEAALFVWVVQPSGRITFRRVELQPMSPSAQPAIANSGALTNLVTQTRSAMRGLGIVASQAPETAPLRFHPEPDQTSRQLKQLHQVLIAPIADLLPTNPDDRVVFMPQESLFLVPFPALQAADGTALIERHTILTAPAIQVLGFTRQQRDRQRQDSTHATRPFLIVGNPTMPAVALTPGSPPIPLPPLPGSEQEAQAIAQMWQTAPLIGSAATETLVKQKLPQARRVHLATHGLLEYRSPTATASTADWQIPGAIALATSPTDDGLLTAGEILQLPLQADLVVLSACDTGQGRITGDSVVGLSRALISAGVPSVIVSLWAVPDAPTATLMTEFYRGLQQQPDKARALRQAMLATRAEHPNALNWAAFTLLGESE
jgi:CHAT domain-containing protein/tetratricopeptide (TPR) repeat protein